MIIVVERGRKWYFSFYSLELFKHWRANRAAEREKKRTLLTGTSERNNNETGLQSNGIELWRFIK